MACDAAEEAFIRSADDPQDIGRKEVDRVLEDVRIVGRTPCPGRSRDRQGEQGVTCRSPFQCDEDGCEQIEEADHRDEPEWTEMGSGDEQPADPHQNVLLHQPIDVHPLMGRLETSGVYDDGGNRHEEVGKNHVEELVRHVFSVVEVDRLLLEYVTGG